MARQMDMTISWFEVENFKSIKKLRVDFQPLMVLVGPNGAGKTNLLQALALFLDILSEGSLDPIELYGGYDQLIRRGKKRSQQMRFALCARIQKSVAEPTKSLLSARLASRNREEWTLTTELVLRSKSDAAGIRIESESFHLTSANKEERFARWKDGLLQDHQPKNEAFGIGFMEQLHRLLTSESVGPHPHVGRVLRANGYSRPLPATRLRLDAASLRSDGQLKTSRHGRLLGLSGEGLPLAVERLRKTRQFKNVLAGLQSVYPRVEDVDTVHVLPGQVALRIRERLIQEGLGQANVSDGVMHALALLIALEGTPGGEVLAIEEPENALHPWALRKLMARAQELPRTAPLLLTTHSPTLVDAVTDPRALFIVENHPTKGTMIVQASQKEAALDAILADSGQGLGQVWMGGSLGGIPEGEE